MSTEQKVEQLTDEFETVKQLLASAASFAESSSSRVDQISTDVRELVQSQQETDREVRNLLQAQAASDRRIDQLMQSQQETDRTVRQLGDKIDRVVEAQAASDRKMEQLAEAQAKTDKTLENFVFHVQRLMVNQAEQIDPLKGKLEQLEGIVRFLVQKESQAAAQRQHDEEERKAERERLDRKFDELISQMAEDRKQAAIDRAESQRKWEANQAEIQRIWQYLMQQ